MKSGNEVWVTAEELLPLCNFAKGGTAEWVADCEAGCTHPLCEETELLTTSPGSPLGTEAEEAKQSPYVGGMSQELSISKFPTGVRSRMPGLDACVEKMWEWGSGDYPSVTIASYIIDFNYEFTYDDRHSELVHLYDSLFNYCWVRDRGGGGREVEEWHWQGISGERGFPVNASFVEAMALYEYTGVTHGYGYSFYEEDMDESYADNGYDLRHGIAGLVKDFYVKQEVSRSWAYQASIVLG